MAEAETVKLVAVLQRVCRILQDSSDSPYSHSSVADIQAQLNDAIKSLKNGDLPNIWELRLLFAPTGALQDISIDNDWGTEFLTLAKCFDEIS